MLSPRFAQRAPVAIVALASFAVLGGAQTPSGTVHDRAPELLARGPAAIAVRSDGSKAYVAGRLDGTLTVIDVASGAVGAELRVAPTAFGFRGAPVDVAVDPEDRHVFVVHALARHVAVVDAASETLVQRLPAPAGCQALAFDFSAGRRRVYVTNDRDDAVLVWEEAPLGTFTRLPDLPLAGLDPRPIAVAPSGALLVGLRGTHGIEVIDPDLPPGSAPLAETALGSLPLDVVVAGSAYLVPTFTPTPAGPRDGINEVLRLSLATHQVVSRLLQDLGTDYLDVDVSPTRVAVACAGSGAVLVVDAASGALLQRVPLTSGAPLSVPVSLAFASGPAGLRLLVVDPFRETVRPIALSGTPPFALLPEIALARIGRARLPLQDLSPLEDGERFFQSGEFFLGTTSAPNPATCATCHPGAGADGLRQRPSQRQVPALFRSDQTTPIGWQGQFPRLDAAQIRGTFNTHGIVAGTPPNGAENLVLAFLVGGTAPPPSPFLDQHGAPSPEALLGQALFQGSAGCAACHSAPLFIPAPPLPLTLAGGVGTGLAPANVPSLRAAWNTGPYLHDGSARTLREVLTENPANQHGTTAHLSSAELDFLVAYLRSL